VAHIDNSTDTKQTRIVKKTVPTESFFNFFSPPKAPTDDDDDDVSDDIEERLELDYQLGEDIKEKLIPRAIDWFTGEALAFEELDDLDENDFDEDDDEDDDDLSDDRDEDEEESDEDVCVALLSNPLTELTTDRKQDDAAKPNKEAAECKQS
jgi:nucleosome assembly protein 1-like 1